MSNLRRLTALISAIACMCACQDAGRYTKIRTKEECALYKSINDSMQHKTAGALNLIQEQMERATDSLAWYDYHLMYGRHYLLSEHPDSLLPYAERTLRFVNSIKTETPRTRGLAAMAVSSIASYHYLLHHSADSVIALYKEAYRLMSKSDIKDALPDLSANLGDAYVATNDLPNASKWYRRALYLTDSLGMPDKQTLTFYMGLGRIYTTLRDFEQAEYYYQMTDRRIDELKPNMKSYFLNNYGNYFYFRKEYGQALETFRRLKAHIESYHAEENFDMFLCQINMADIFLNLHQTDSARYYVSLAEPHFRELGVDLGVYYAQTIRIGIALEEGNYQEVERILKEKQAVVSDVDIKGIRNLYMKRYYAAIGDYKQAFSKQEEAIEAHKAEIGDRQHLRTSDIMTRLTEDTIRLHHQLAMNQREVAYAKSLNRLTIVIGLLIIIILLFALWFNHERKRRLQTRLDMQNLRMLNVRQRVSPHFVFNVLNSRITKAEEPEADQLMMLAHLIRTNLDLTRRNIVTLDEELDFVSQYVAIEQKVSKIDFNFSIQAPAKELLQKILVPSMLVEILTENAILHGLKNKEGNKELCIKVTVDEHEVRISVIDNGPGFDIRQYNSERSRTGLDIIRTTVSVVNQDNPTAKMHFDIHNEDGCHAILTIPRNIKYTTL